MSAIVLPAVVTDMLLITLDPAAASAINSTVPRVPQPPSILNDELIVRTEPGIFGLPICTSPVTELTTNTSSSGSAQLDILNFCCCSARDVITLMYSGTLGESFLSTIT